MATMIACAQICMSCQQAPRIEDPIDAIVEALDSVWVVAIGENHGHLEFHDWLIRALEDPAIQQRVDDVIVEFGNAMYQPVADRFTSGEPLPMDSVRLIWRNSIVSPNTVWDSPVYERLVRSIRTINGERSDQRQYRLVLADAPIDWDNVVTRRDLAPGISRSEHMAEIVSRETLRQGRRGLLIAGGAHLTRSNMVRENRSGVPTAEVSVVARLAQKHPGTLFVIRSIAKTGTLDPGHLSFITPGSLARTDLPQLANVSANAVSTMRNSDGTAFGAYGGATIGDIVDAIIYWGTTDQNHFPSAPAQTYTDESYWDELNRRSEIVRGQPMDPSLRDNH